MAKQKITNTLDKAVMTDDGLKMNGVIMQTVVEKCDGCERAVKHESGGTYCTSYAQPERKWAMGACNFATHVRAEVTGAGKVKINPLKASKRAARGR